MAKDTKKDTPDLPQGASADFDRPGVSAEEAGKQIEELTRQAESREVEAPDRELVDAAKERAQETGSLEDAVRALSLEEESDAAAATGNGPGPEPIPFEKLAEETGVSPDSLMVKAKVRGEEVEIPLSEAVNGYQRQEDYTRSKQELAEIRQQADETREAYAQRLEMLAIGLQQQGVSEEALQGIASEYNRVVGEVQGRIHENLAETVEAEQEKLRETFDWSDDSAWEEARGQLREYAHSLGFSDSELQSVHDHRLLAVLEKARLYEEGNSRAQAVRERSRESGPVTLTPGTPKPKPSRQDAEKAAAFEQLRRSGRRTDAARVLSILGTDDL